MAALGPPAISAGVEHPAAPSPKAASFADLQPNSQAWMPRRPMQVHPGKAQSPQARKLEKATQEFEGLLVSSLWQDMTKGFGDLDGSDSDGLAAGFDALQGVGFDALATSMASAGGLGLARMLFHSLAPALTHSNAKRKPDD